MDGRKWGAPPPPKGVRPYRYVDKNSLGIAPLSDHFMSKRELERQARDDAAAAAEAEAKARTLAARHQRLATERSNKAIKELMDRADKALRDRTPEQVEDDRRWGESVHASFEAVHGRPVAEFGIDRLQKDKPAKDRDYRPVYTDKYLEDVTSTRPAALRSDDLASYAEPHEDDYTGGGTLWDDDSDVYEAGL